MSTRQRYILLTTLLLLTACGPTNVVVTGKYPEPLTQQISLNAGAFYDPEFRQYVHSDESGAGLSIAIGESQTALFTEVFNQLFTGFAVVESIEDAKSQHLDLTISPHVEEIQVALPRDTQLKIFEFWIKYNIQVFDEKGEPIADWIMTSYGKTMDQFMDSKEDAINQSAIVALRDTGAQLVTKFHLAPGVREWLKERLAESDTGENDE